jgi:tetratricopeptide (TPR) repeat protein
VALSRLAEYAYATGRYDDAARRAGSLLAVDPKNRDYLRLAGLANFKTGQFAEALVSWRTLSLGLPRGSEEWFEAKYHQVASLAETDQAQARQALQQLQLLYPDYGSSAWQEKFESLAQRLK